MKLIIIHSEEDERDLRAQAKTARDKVVAAFEEAAKDAPDWMPVGGVWVMWPSGDQIGRLLERKAKTAEVVRHLDNPRAAWRYDRVLVINLPRIRKALSRMFRPVTST